MLENSVLCLDGTSSDNLTFLSSASTAWNHSRVRARQVLASEDGYLILCRRFPKLALLAAKYMRPMALGNLELELLPSGESAGSSLLLVRKGTSSMLYVSHWSPEKDPHVRQMIVKEAQRIFWRPTADPLAAPVPPRAEIERFLAWFQKNNAENVASHLVVNPVRDLPRILPWLAAAGIVPIFDETTATVLQNLKLPDNNGSASTMGSPLHVFSRPGIAQLKKRPLPEGRWATSLLRGIDDGGVTLPAEIEVETQFRFFPVPTLSDFVKLAAAAKAREIIVSAPGGLADSLVSALQGHRLSAWVLAAPRTETLF